LIRDGVRLALACAPGLAPVLLLAAATRAGLDLWPALRPPDFPTDAAGPGALEVALHAAAVSAGYFTLSTVLETMLGSAVDTVLVLRFADAAQGTPRSLKQLVPASLRRMPAILAA